MFELLKLPKYAKKISHPIPFFSQDHPFIWSNYSDLTRPHPKWWFSKGNPLISGKSRLVKYYNLARFINFRGCLFPSPLYFDPNPTTDMFPWNLLHTSMQIPGYILLQPGLSAGLLGLHPRNLTNLTYDIKNDGLENVPAFRYIKHMAIFGIYLKFRW